MSTVVVGNVTTEGDFVGRDLMVSGDYVRRNQFISCIFVMILKNVSLM